MKHPIGALTWGSVSSLRGDCMLLASATGLFWLGTPGTPLEKGLVWAQKHGWRVEKQDGSHPILRQTILELQQYFAEERVTFTVPLDLYGTPFQLAVWHELCNIPYGKTCSYGELAHKLGRPLASRAVGAANGANPVSIIVPCHRVIGSDGSLTGYGGGLPTKDWLLKLEGAALPKDKQNASLVR